jgi:hypothetical protein
LTRPDPPAFPVVVSAQALIQDQGEPVLCIAELADDHSLADAAEAHIIGEAGHVAGKLVLKYGSRSSL